MGGNNDNDDDDEKIKEGETETTTNDDNNNTATTSDEIKQMLEQYEKECHKRKLRAEKFGIQYVQPSQGDVLPWSKLKRFRTEQKQQSSVEQQQKRFVSGIDILDPNEIAKMEARKARFGNNNVTTTNPDNNRNNHNDNNNEGSGGGGGGENEGTSMNVVTDDAHLPVIQAWDKEEMVRPYRNDPPKSLWQDRSIPSLLETQQEVDNRSSFAMQPREDPTWIKDKIHLFAIDWAAFKQIRNKDLMSYFSDYGPTYIEWMGDLSCNVCFNDMHTATRAVMKLSQEIPSPPPKQPTSNKEEEPGNDDKDYDTDGSSDNKQQQHQTSVELRPDFGNMNWRFCLKPIRKVANDRYGRQNTIARVLMRLALSTDTLDERPNSWPAPPGGFSSTKVLGPDSDCRHHRKEQHGKNRRNNNKKRQRGGGEGNAKNNNEALSSSYTGTGEHPLLSRGLTSSRGGGFSIEELEKERAAKRTKRTEPGES